MTYSQRIIESFGGFKAMAEKVGLPVSTIQYWGQVGRVPAKQQQMVLDVGLEVGLAISPESFFDHPAGTPR